MASQALPASPPSTGLLAIDAWRTALSHLGIAALVIIALFWRDVTDMFLIYWNISTYNHILFVPVIIGWLVSMRLPELAKLRPEPWIGGLAVVGAGAVLWLLGYAAGVSVARHLALVLLLQGVVVSLLGYRVTLALLFPLAYAFFLVPVGEEIVPWLQTVTADLSMILLAWSNIPAHIEGIFISTPTGYFRVAEACSGIQFLVAMLAYGALAANVCYKSPARRALFMAACVVMPILANGVRAWGTMFIATYQGNDFAAGFDHIFYGWIFFALVLALVMGMGWKFFDRSLADDMVDGDAIAATPVPFAGVGAKAVPYTLALLIVLPLGWTQALVAQPAAIPAQIALPEVKGWQQVPFAPRADWQPKQAGADHRLLGSYRNNAGQVVDLYIALYDGQEEGREMVAYGQGAHDPASKWAWTANGKAIAGGKSDILTAPGPVVREADSFYRYGDLLTGSGFAVKLETMKVRLLGLEQPAIVVIVSAEDSGARAAIDAFLRDMGPVDAMADRIAGVK